MLVIDNLCVSVEGSTILSAITAQFLPGSIHALMGPNGSGKSTLAHVVMGHPSYSIDSGTIILSEEPVNALSSELRAKKGIFLAFQQPLVVPGVSVFTFLKESWQAVHETTIAVDQFIKIVEQHLEILGIDRSFLDRNLNDGFSGGESKKFEILQMLLLKPNIAILDEIDSGLDVDALKTVARGIRYAKERDPDLILILITHYQRILHEIVPDFVHIMSRGRIVHSGNATLARVIEQKGYDEICS